MLDGEAAFQIAYDTKLTVLSFFMPILVLLVAFVVVTASAQVAWWRIYLSGSLSGGAICGMHYIANLSISNYHTTYHISYVVGAALIAVLASSAALALFFVFETSWTNSWWKRAGCAMVLAGAVSGMHWCAAVGTQYTLIASSSTNAGGSSVSRSDTTIIVACLSIAACAIITASLMFSTYVRRVSARKAQKVVLASAVFDSRGRIMVSYEGILPSQVVTTAFIPRVLTFFLLATRIVILTFTSRLAANSSIQHTPYFIGCFARPGLGPVWPASSILCKDTWNSCLEVSHCLLMTMEPWLAITI